MRRSLLPLLLAAAATGASAVPVTITTAGYWYETVGSNTIGIAGGGSALGTATTLFIANTTPDVNNGTTAAATQNGVGVGAVGVDGTLWARRAFNPGPSQLTPLTVTFSNGADSATYTGRDLNGLAAMPLVQNLQANGSGDPFGPLVSWTLPGAAGDVDLIQIVFFNNATNLEVGNRVVLAPTATFYDIASGALQASFDLTVNVRLIDLADDSLPFSNENIQRMSRTYVNYLAPVPEPAPAALLLLGLAALGWTARRQSAAAASRTKSSRS